MTKARVTVGLALLLVATLSAPLAAQGPGYFPEGSDDPTTIDRFDHRNYQFRGDFGDGVGYEKGFQTFGVFQPIVVEPDEFIFFVNPRGIVTYLGDLAANAGGGFRWYDTDNDRIWGGSFWYDHDNNSSRKFDQFGISLESLGQYFDVRANAYLLTNDDRDNLGSFFTGQNQFFQNFIGIGRATIFNTPLNGGDFELGGLIPGIGDFGIRPYVGGYYYQGQGTGAVYGVRTRAEALITQDFWATVMFTHDRLFGNNLTGAVTWYYGSGQAPRWFQRIPVQDRMYQQVERQYRIAVYEEVFKDTVLALRNGGTGGSGGPVGTPIFVVHVDNSAPAGGDGTVEAPLNFLPTSTDSNVDIVFVRRGTNTSVRYDNGITLNDWQRLLGDGVPHDFTSTMGTFVLPGFTAGPFPNLTNPAGDVITLANHNEVSGFNIDRAGRHGIAGTGILDFNINNVNISNSGSAGPPPVGAGIALANVRGTGKVFSATLTNNNEDGLQIANDGDHDLELRVDDVTATGNLSGIAIAGANGTDFNVIMRNVNTSDNEHDGIAVALENASFVGVFDRITSNSNNVPEDDLGFGNGLAFAADASILAVRIERSDFNNNNLNGIAIAAANGSDLDIEILNNNSTINGNGLSGVFLDAFDSNTNITLKNNIISNNGNIGVNLRATDGLLNLVAGGLLTEDVNGNGLLDVGEDLNGNGVLDREGNILDGNNGAGIAYTLRNAATGTVDIRGNIITRTQNDTLGSLIYNGQAIDIRLDGSTGAFDSTAVLTSGIIDRNTLGDRFDASLGNVGRGINILADQQTSLTNLTIGNDDGDNNNGNIIANNGGAGIAVLRRNEAVVDNVRILDNLIDSNATDGIRIIAENSPNDVNDYVVQDNLITNNGAAGIALHVTADAQINIDIFDNLIDDNGSHGIHATELANSAADLRSIGGDWSRNEITNNNGSGIRLDGATSNLTIGSTTTAADGNLIADNNGRGIFITGAGDVEIGFNEITRNAVHGIDIQGASANNVGISRNYIHDNLGDGIEILAQGPFSTVVDITLNTIRDNAGRGIDILNRANPGNNLIAGLSFINIDENVIAGNLLEGVYVINTASFTQNQDNPATDPLAADGNVFADPTMFLFVTNNRIEGNGINSPFTASGIVLRVGTSGGGYGFTDDGGFFGEGRSGVGATISSNILHGNLGDDVYIDSFTSTVDPIDTAGTWSDTEFTITAFQGDPLARLDLVFQDNEADSYDVVNIGAFYNNGEAAFKSRQNDATDPGPFISGDRQRNAQRLAARFGLGPATPGGLSDSFLYSGIGQSTFRLTSAVTGNTFAGGAINPFATPINGVDDFYTDPFTDSNGIFRATGFGRIETMPYGWNRLGGDPRPQ